MSDLPVDEPEQQPPAAEAPPVPPAYAEILARLGLPADAHSVVITAESAIAIAGDYPEPYTPPQEA